VTENLLRKGQKTEIKINGLGSSGEGVGKYQGIAVFVPGALPGEKVLASVVSVKKNYAVGTLLEVKEESPDRVRPACPVYEKCGGCQLQHISYAAELREKRRQVYDALTRIGHLTQVNVLPTLGANNPQRYRNKMQFPAAGTCDSVKIGCFAEGTHHVINVTDCLIESEENNTIAKVAREWMRKYKIQPYNEDTRRGMVRHVMGRVGVHTGEVMACLVTAQDMIPHMKEFVRMLRSALPDLKSVVQNVNKRNTNVILGNTTRLIWGRETIRDCIGNLHFNISCQSFFQVNSAQAEKLYNVALEYAGLTGNETVADVYCGTGTITLFLAQKARMAYGIEIVPSAIRDAKRNAAENNIVNAKFILGDAAYKLPELLQTYGVKPDVVVLDPPRAGCEERVLNAIVKSAPQRIVYVSCNPATLARDLAFLDKRGYGTEKVQPVDMFSRTRHVETVVLMSRVEK